MQRDLMRLVFTIISVALLLPALFSGCSSINDVPPFILSITPTIGTVNTQVTIKGSDFAISPTGNTVRFNGKTATIVSGNPFEIVVLVPEAAGTGKVTVSTSAGTSEGPEFKYLDAHTISSVEPLSGRFGEEVTITGENFDDFPGGTIVRFNGSVANVKSLSKTQVVVFVPEGAGTGKITVRTGAGVIDGPIFEYLFTATVSTFAGDGTMGFANSTLLESRFNTPSGLAFDQSDNLLICDRDNNIVRKISVDGTVSTFAGSGSPSSADGNGLLASFAKPNFIAVDGEGNIFISEATSGNVRKITLAGVDVVVSTFAGTGLNEFADGNGTSAAFNTPSGLAINAQGQIFLGDLGNARVRQLTPEAVVSTLAGNGTQDYVDGTGAGASFMGPHGVVVDVIGDLLVTDVHKIRKVTLDGVVTTYTGSETAGFVDGILETARFNGARGLAKLKNESIVVADTDNHAIRLITLAGTVITIAGDGTPGYVNGNGEEAKFNQPVDLAVNSRNEIYVADRLNHVIRKIILK